MSDRMWTAVQRCLGALAFSLMLAACGGGVTETDPPPSGGTDSTGTNQPPPGTVPRASITVTVSFGSEYAAAAAAAGLSVEGLTVTVKRATGGSIEGTTNSSGTVVFSDLLEGRYSVGVERVLTEAERNRLPEGVEATIFTGGTQLALSPPAGQSIDVELLGLERGSLVVSEVFPYTGPGGLTYNDGHYVEVFNNSDTVIYLDGIHLFNTNAFVHNGLIQCVESQRFRIDPERVWIHSIRTFPGGGRDFPIQPGTGQVMAISALNHRAISGRPEFPDLSRAEFEIIGNEADPDNPVSANTIDGFGAIPGPIGVGSFAVGVNAVGLALPQATANLVRDSALANSRIQPLSGIRAEYVLDIFATELTPGEAAFLKSINNYTERCNPWFQPWFERSPAPLYYTREPRAIRRKEAGYSAAGNLILQRTRTSERDLEYGPLLKRSLER